MRYLLHIFQTAIFLIVTASAFATTTYTYDAQDRLISVGYTNKTGVSYGYDKAGNLLSQTLGANTGGTNGGGTNSVINKLAPQLTSPYSATFYVGKSGSFTIKASGSPSPTFSINAVPSWATLDAITGVLSGTPTNEAIYCFQITATNGVSPSATQSFRLSKDFSVKLVKGVESRWGSC